MGYQFLPPLSDDERKALRESIETFGVLHHVVTDEDGAIIDGHHRAEVAAELGIEYSTTVLPGLSEEEKIETALTLNLGRRHLGPEEKRGLVADLRKRGLSVRWISEKTGIPKSTVHRYSQRVPGGTPEYIGGRDGKRYRATRPDDPLDNWRQELRDVVGYPVAVSVDELREQIKSDPFLESWTDWNWEIFDHTMYLMYLGRLEGHCLLRIGKYPPENPLLSEVDAEKVHRFADVTAGAFIGWAEQHDMYTEDVLCPPDREVFAACKCEECQETRDQIGDLVKNAAYTRALGHWAITLGIPGEEE